MIQKIIFLFHKFTYKESIFYNRIRMYDYKESGFSNFNNTTLPGSLSIKKNTDLVTDDKFTFAIDFGTGVEDGKYSLDISEN